MRSSKRLKPESEKTNASRRSARGEAVRASGNGMSSSTMIMIGGGVAALLLIGLLFALKSSDSNKTKSAKAPVKQEEFSDRTPSTTWERRAKERDAHGDRLGAIDDYHNAADAATREGNTRAAENYSMGAYQLQKFTPLNYSGKH